MRCLGIFYGVKSKFSDASAPNRPIGIRHSRGREGFGFWSAAGARLKTTRGVRPHSVGNDDNKYTARGFQLVGSTVRCQLYSFAKYVFWRTVHKRRGRDELMCGTCTEGILVPLLDALFSRARK